LKVKMAELMPGEATARELAKPIAERFKYLDLPDGVLAYIVEAVVDAAHEGLTVAEGLSGNIQPPLTHYVLGYIHGLTDVERGHRDSV
jgi:hypothetical protein